MAVTIEQIKESIITGYIVGIAEKYGIEKFKIKFDSKKGSVLLRTKIHPNQNEFTDEASEYILKNEFANQVRFTYPTKL